MKGYLVVWLDQNEIPRAWGYSNTREEAEQRASLELAEYRKGRPDVTGWHSRVKTLMDGKEAA